MKKLTPQDRANAKWRASLVGDKLERERTRRRIWVRANESNKRARLRNKLAGQIPNKELVAWIAANINRPCIYCGEEATHIDHITPISRGGTQEFSNLEMICSTCNFGKGSKTKDEYKKWILKLVNYQQEETKA